MRSRFLRPASAGRPSAISPYPPFVAAAVVLALPALVSAATLGAHVVDPDGRAVPGAQIVATTALGAVAECTTDARGSCAMRALAAGSYDVHVVAPGFQADPITVALGEDDARELTLPLRVSAVSESILVSASQIDLPLSRAADDVTVVTAADLEAHQIESVDEALRLVPGLAVTRSGGRGAITSLFPRGGSSNYTLVLVDGIRANDFGGGYDFSRLSVADIDRIEIVRGPESALFGSDAIGAVVQIVTRRGGAPRVDGTIEGGGFGTERATVGASGSRGRWSFGGGAEQARSDGYTGLAPASGERVTNDDWHRAHASGSAEWQRPAGPDVLLTATMTRDERGFPGPFGSDPAGLFPGVDRISRGTTDERQAGARVTHPWSATVRQRLEANYTDTTSDFTSPYGLSTSGTRRFDGRVQEDVALSASFGASIGLEALRERGSSTYITGAAGEPFAIARGILGTFGEVRWASRERLFVTAGVRVERLTRDAVEPSVDPFAPRPAFPSQTLDSVNPKIAVSYLVTPPASRASTRLRASAGSGIRPPDAFEIAFTDNPDLKPERSRSIDAGVDQQFAGGAFALSATAFVNRYDDLIVAVGRALRDASQFETDNISNARAAGVELSGQARVGSHVTVHGSYTFLDTAILSVDGLARTAPPPFTVGDPLIRRPRHQGAIDAVATVGRTSAFAELTTRSEMLDVEPNEGAFGGLFFARGYAVVNAGAARRLTRNVEVYARVLNLFDRAYEETLGFPALGRSALAGIRVAAGR